MAKTEKTCTVCGATFIGGAGAMYCPTCKRTRKTELERERRKNGGKRKIGSTAICEKCGAEYTVRGALQKYCDTCRPPRKPPKAPPKIEIVPTKRKRAPSKSRIVECKNCGKEFSTNGGRTIYCIDCRSARDPSYIKHVGTETTCADCGAQFTITMINQKFCPACREARKNPPPKKPKKPNPPKKTTKNSPKKTSDVVGVSFVKATAKWRVKYKGKEIGRFDTEGEAIEARKKAESATEKRYCVVCGKEIPMCNGYYHALACSDACRAERKRAYNNARYNAARKDSILYKNLFAEIPSEMKKRISTEAQVRNCTIAKYIRDLIQKEFDALDKERNDKPE